MKSRKFPTMEEAMTYLKAAGDATYWGREGNHAEKLVYTLTVDAKVYDVYIYTNGLLEVTGERYKD